MFCVLLRKIKLNSRPDENELNSLHMTSMLPRSLLFVMAVCWTLVSCDNSSQNSSLPLLLVSFDGFRADYLKSFHFPNLQQFFSGGVLVERLTNAFPTKTFPNHYSLVTGLFVESHGIVGNAMYDNVTGKRFSLQNDSDPFWWEEATPIWLSVQEAGFGTAAAMWPGTDVAIHNRTSTHFMRYDPQVTFRERVTNLTAWLSANQSVKFAALYWEEPDRAGHTYGPENLTEMSRVLKEVDDNVGFLVENLKATGLWEKINVIVTSDHGMVQCSQDRLIRLDSCLDPSTYSVVDLTPVADITPLANVSDVYRALSTCHPNMKAYLKDEIPKKLHYRNNRRIQPIVLVADEGWTIVQRGDLPRLGDHGYDNTLPSMQPFLAASGPSFQRGQRLSSLHSVDLYPLMCALLGVQEQPHNGTMERARCLLAGQSCVDLPTVVGVVIGVLMLLATFTFIFIFTKGRAISSSRPFARLELQEEDDDDPLLE